MSTTSKSRQARRKGKQPIGAKSKVCPWVGGYRSVDVSRDAIAVKSHTHTVYVPNAMSTRVPSNKELKAKGAAHCRRWSLK